MNDRPEPTLRDLLAQVVSLSAEVKGLTSAVSQESRKRSKLEEVVGGLREELRVARASAHVPFVNSETLKYSKGWRAMFQLGALVTPTLGFVGFLNQDEKLLWIARNFVNFSVGCTSLACFGNPRNIHSWKEKAFIGTSWLTFISGQFFFGLGLIRLEDEGAIRIGKITMMFVVFHTCISLPGFLYATKLFSRFSDAKLSRLMLSAFQSVPSLLGSLLYVVSTSFHCITQSDEKLGSVVDQCGNPTAPAASIGSYLFVAWVLCYLAAPLASDTSTLSWKNVMELKMSKMQFILGSLFGALSLITLITFANTNENGSKIDDFLHLMTTLYSLTFFVFFSTVIFDLLVKPRFFRSATTNDVVHKDSSGAFGLHESSLAPGML